MNNITARSVSSLDHASVVFNAIELVHLIITFRSTWAAQRIVNVEGTKLVFDLIERVTIPIFMDYLFKPYHLDHDHDGQHPIDQLIGSVNIAEGCLYSAMVELSDVFDDKFIKIVEPMNISIFDITSVTHHPIVPNHFTMTLL